MSLYPLQLGLWFCTKGLLRAPLLHMFMPWSFLRKVLSEVGSERQQLTFCSKSYLKANQLSFMRINLKLYDGTCLSLLSVRYSDGSYSYFWNSAIGKLHHPFDSMTFGSAKCNQSFLPFYPLPLIYLILYRAILSYTLSMAQKDLAKFLSMRLIFCQVIVNDKLK